MHLESYEVFRTVVQERSVTKAAQLLHMTQSTASRHLQALEQEYGALLFERSASGLSLTSLGRSLYPYALDLLNCHEHAKEEMQRLRNEGGGLSVGATFTIGEYLLPHILGEFRNHYAGAEVRMRVSNTSQVVDDLRRHRIDVGLIEGLTEASDLAVTEWRVDELVLVCYPQHPFAACDEVDLEEMVGQSLLMREEGSGTRQVTEHALEQAGMLARLSVFMELGSTQAIKSAVAAGFGIAFLSMLTVAEEIADGRLVHVPIRGLHIMRELSIVQRPARHVSFLVEALLRELRRVN